MIGRDDPTDARIITESWSEPHVFETLFDRHFDTIVRYAATRVGLDHAADVAAETFVRAFDQRKKFDATRSSALPWLIGIATNIAREHHRKAARGQRAWSRSIPAAEQSALFETDAASRVDAAALRVRLEEALSGLSEDEYAVLMLAVMGDLSYLEIADRLSIPIGTVRSRLARARRRVRELIEVDRPIPSGEVRDPRTRSESSP